MRIPAAAAAKRDLDFRTMIDDEKVNCSLKFAAHLEYQSLHSRFTSEQSNLMNYT